MVGVILTVGAGLIVAGACWEILVKIVTRGNVDHEDVDEDAPDDGGTGDGFGWDGDHRSWGRHDAGGGDDGTGEHPQPDAE